MKKKIEISFENRSVIFHAWEVLLLSSATVFKYFFTLAPHFSRPGSLSFCTIDFYQILFLLWEWVLCIVGCLASPLDLTHWMPRAPPPPSVTTKNVSKHCHMSPGRAKLPTVVNHLLSTKAHRTEGSENPAKGVLDANDCSHQF